MFLSPRIRTFANTRALRVALTFVVICVLIFTVRLQRRPPSISSYTSGTTTPWRKWNETSPSSPTSPSNEELYLYYLVQNYGLTWETPWVARRIRTTASAKTRLSVTDVPKRFMTGDFTETKIYDQNVKSRAGDPVTLPVHGSPRPGEIDASVLLVGVSTTYSRVVHSDYAVVRDWQRWLSNGYGTSNGATLLVTLHRSTAAEASKVSESIAKTGIQAEVVHLEEDMDGAARYQDMIKRLVAKRSDLEQHGQKKKYLVLADDDTFFPNVHQLLQRLSRYSPSKEHYLGAPSERLDWTMTANRTMSTYGGGAVILTPALAERVSKLSCSGDGDSQKKLDDPVAWDYALYQCITSQTSLHLQVMPSFYNPAGDEALMGADGAALNEGYGGGALPLTLHQYRSFHRFEAGRGHDVASVCGEDCFLQRFRFRDNWILVAGYTVSHYPDGVSAVPLKQSRKLVAQYYKDLWRAALGKKLAVDAPARPLDTKVVHWTGPKRTWRLLDSRVRESGEVWQAYVKRRSGENAFSDIDDRLEWGEGEDQADRDSLVILIWES